MWSISARVKPFIFLLLAILMSSCLSRQKMIQNELESTDERKIVLAIDSLLKNQQFEKAEHYGRLFLNRYEHSPYVDDVAYRMAYLHVIADAKNPFFNYSQALKSFRLFLKKFPASQYAFACNNWLKVLYLTSQLQKQVETLQNENRKLKYELNTSSAQIEQLKNTLRDLEKVIKR